jgi:putative transposase
LAEKKSGLSPVEQKKSWVEPTHESLSIRRQCELLELNRSTLYYQAKPVPDEELQMMRMIDEIYTRCPFYGSRRITAQLNRDHCQQWNRKRIQRLMRIMGIRGVAPGPDTSKPHPQNKIYPYLLRGMPINKVNQVWSTDITYIPMPHGFMYLVAVIDWYSRYVLSWQLSNTMETSFCTDALEAALAVNTPTIFNTDQGVQFTSKAFTQILLDKEIKISMDGRGRAFDNIFVERLWRTVKYENIYMNDYQNVPELLAGLKYYFDFYNQERLHERLGYVPPVEVYFS